MAASRRRCVAARGGAVLIAALPVAATFIPGRSLAEIRLGATAAEVRRRLGTNFGFCRGCATTTWYFTYRRFDDKGLGVELTHGRVTAVYTLWQPPGWKDTHGLKLGAPEATVTATTGVTTPIACAGYTALVARTSVYYIVNGALWGFGLVRRGRSPCR